MRHVMREGCGVTLASAICPPSDETLLAAGAGVEVHSSDTVEDGVDEVHCRDCHECRLSSQSAKAIDGLCHLDAVVSADPAKVAGHVATCRLKRDPQREKRVGMGNSQFS